MPAAFGDNQPYAFLLGLHRYAGLLRDEIM